MLHPYASRGAAETRARTLTDRTGNTHTVEPAPRCLHAGPEAWYVVGPRERVGRPVRVDRRVYGTNKPETWVSDVLDELTKWDHEPREWDHWQALVTAIERGEDNESARHTEAVKVRITPEHARRLRALAAGDPVSRVVERLIDGAWEGRVAE